MWLSGKMIVYQFEALNSIPGLGEGKRGVFIKEVKNHRT